LNFERYTIIIFLCGFVVLIFDDSNHHRFVSLAPAPLLFPLVHPLLLRPGFSFFYFFSILDYYKHIPHHGGGNEKRFFSETLGQRQEQGNFLPGPRFDSELGFSNKFLPCRPR